MLVIKSMTHVIILPFFAAILLLAPLSCGDDESGETWTNVSKSNTYSVAGDQVFLVDTTGNVNLTYTLDLGAVARDVYFIFSNTTMSDAGSNPVVQNMGEEEAEYGIMSDDSELKAQANENLASKSEIGQRGTTEISEYNKNPFLHSTSDVSTSTAIRNMIAVPAPLLFTVGDEIQFYYEKNTNSITAVCRHKKIANTKTLHVWIEKDLYPGTINDTQIEDIGNKFLYDGTNDDIYEWVSTIFGAEWGTHGYSELIQPTDEIHILIYDMGFHDPDMTNVIGFYWGKDNFTSSSINYSNQKIMFYINSSFVNSNISEVYSTLAHEFQHMINFYQKNVLRVPDGDGPETWINEMCSMVAEDLVATKIQVNGPRGVSYLLGSAGSSNNIKGRLPLYNYYNNISFVTWLTTYPEVLRSYSINYSFGAYLARNFGGAPFFRKLVQNQYTDYHAVDYALTQSGFSEDFSSVQRKWAAANLLSDNFSPPSGYYQYNKNDWFTSTVDSISYDLGSINLYNYYHGGQTGPRVFTSSIPYGKEAASNVYYQAGTNLTGTITRSITMEDNIKLTVVVKE